MQMLGSKSDSERTVGAGTNRPAPERAAASVPPPGAEPISPSESEISDEDIPF
jgi:hypothetical protein